jgi:hypothetical protein
MQNPSSHRRENLRSHSDEDVGTIEPTKEILPAPNQELLKLNLEEGDFVVVMHEGKHYPGLVTKLPDGKQLGPTVDCMSKTKKSWKWPEKRTF